jgi:hypothetical protein
VTDDRPILTSKHLEPGDLDKFMPTPGNAWTESKPLTVADLHAAIERASTVSYEPPQMILHPRVVDHASAILGRQAITQADMWEAASIEYEQAVAARAAYLRTWRGKLSQLVRDRVRSVSTRWRRKDRDWWDD